MIVNLLTHPTGAGVGDICRPPPASSGHPGCPRLAFAAGWGPRTTPGAVGAKEQCFWRAVCVGPPRWERRTMRSCNIVNFTTLGNGYLGSRIDEERSEMRYLV
jgi:hypothetical protein